MVKDSKKQNEVSPDEQPLRKISQEKLNDVLDKHARYLDYEKTGGECASLVRCDLTRRVHFDTSPDLTNADLASSSFEGQFLPAPIFDNTNLINANFRGAVLRPVQVEKGQPAKVDTIRRRGASFKKACLIGADFEEAELPEACFDGANLQWTSFRNAKLQGADLSGALNLQVKQLAGADLSGAILPNSMAEFESLKQVEELSKNTRKIFFAMLLTAAFLALTSISQSTIREIGVVPPITVPIVGTEISVLAFFLFAPLVLSVLFAYFQLHLVRNFERLSTMPAVFPDTVTLDQKVYPWLMNGLVWWHLRLLRIGPRPMFATLQRVVLNLLAWWAVPGSLLVIWFRYLAERDVLGILIHFAAFIFCVTFARRSRHGIRALFQSESMESPRQGIRTWLSKDLPFRLRLIAGLALMLVISWAAVLGVPYPGEGLRSLAPQVLQAFGWEPFPVFAGRDISVKPEGWTGDSTQIALVKGAELAGRDLSYLNGERAFLVNADLRGADLRYADLGYADLRGATLDEAYLFRASFAGCNLSGATLRWTYLYGADLRAAEGLTVDQLRVATGDNTTILPDYIDRDLLPW